MHFWISLQTYHCSLLQQKMSTSDCNFSGSVKQKFPWQKYSISCCHHSVESWKKYSMLFCPLMKYRFSFKYIKLVAIFLKYYEEKYISVKIWNLVFIYIWGSNLTPNLEIDILDLVGHLDSLLYSMSQVVLTILKDKKNMESVYYVRLLWVPFSNFDPELDHENCFGQEDISKCDTSRDF